MNNLGLLILRVGFSALMLTHGIPKFMKLINGDFSFGDPIGIGALPTLILAVIGEVVAPVLVMIGFKTKWSTLPIIATMAVAAFVVHAGDPIGSKEKALVYLIAFVSIALFGGGKYSVDRA
ncbi:MAG: DoxX family protein [Reichenbachiella sp.]